MTLQQQFPIGSTVLNLDNHLAKVVGYHHNLLMVEGIGEFANVGKWLASPEKCTRLSNTHFGIAGKYEYFIFNNTLYRSPMSNPVAPDGFRSGGRPQMALHLIDSEYLRTLGL